jgi:hypothetical protein
MRISGSRWRLLYGQNFLSFSCFCLYSEGGRLLFSVSLNCLSFDKCHCLLLRSDDPTPPMSWRLWPLKRPLIAVLSADSVRLFDVFGWKA